MNKIAKTAVLAALALCPVSGAAQGTDWKAVTHYDKASAKKQLTDRFVKYVTFDTQSSDQTSAMPSTPGQKKFAKELAKELKKNGAKNVKNGPIRYRYGGNPVQFGQKPARYRVFGAHGYRA